MILKGGCLCGAVRYEAHRRPKVSGFCHCRDCQRATGTGHCCYMIFSRDDVVFTGALRAYSMTGGSGMETVRYACEICSSQIFGSGPPEDDRWTVYAGTLDEPSCFKPDIAVMTRCRADWDHLAWDFAEHDGMPG
ncbi:GFA family protein [Rhizobium sp. 32-5/1]|uniref:GFA family protein n=1 Tax=Rhizobium sp. 32-5/1 TaxID=3019602 RepID=UPI00240E808E|nr:GFA family protein [Rhizobium sp. 32-5/1]WEZ82494.1 GFA family protein [Rhizobium sp. 32-5/1]